MIPLGNNAIPKITGLQGIYPTSGWTVPKLLLTQFQTSKLPRWLRGVQCFLLYRWLPEPQGSWTGLSWLQWERRKSTFCPPPAFSSRALLGQLFWTNSLYPYYWAITTPRGQALGWPTIAHHAWPPPALSFPAHWGASSGGSCFQVERSQLTNPCSGIMSFLKN